MSHPLNFRVWSNLSSKWMSNIVINDAGTPILMYSEKVDSRVFHRVYLIDNYQPVVQWSTGLKDKSGVEIYEGDIVSIDQNDSGSVEGAVIWYDVTAQWLVEHDDSLPAPLFIQSKTTVIDTVVEKAVRAALEAATAAAEKAAEPQIVT